LNREEKNLRKELVEKQFEVEYKEKFLKKMQIEKSYKANQERKQEHTNFIQSFMQAKNLIEKQMKIGRKIKDAKVQRQEKQEKVAKIREQRDMEATSKDRVQVRSTLFDHHLDQSISSVNYQQRGSRSLL
jgi:ABC-type Fe3+/spermidine/putrescine transport system ATPase subunit